MGGTRRQVLFVVQGQLMLSYLKEIWQRLQDDDRLCIRVAFDADIDPEVIAATLTSFDASGNRVRRANYWAAMIWPWDLIVFADGTTTWKSFCRTSRKLRVRHGPPAGRLSRFKQDVAWGEWLYRKDGTSAFDLVFVPSEGAKTNGESKCPTYRGRIACVGDLRFDRLLAACREQSRLRKEIGIAEGKRVVLVVSSWGPNCLLQTVGNQLYDACSRLASQFHFILTAHPNNFRRGSDWGRIVEQQAQWGATIVRPNDDWTDFMAVSDALITDYTSMSLYFAALLRPVISIPIAPDIGCPGATMYRMASVATQLQSPDRLKEALEAAFRSEIGEDQRALAKELFSCQGHSWVEMYKQICGLLSLAASGPAFDMG